MNIDERQILIIQFNPKTEEWEDITKRVQWFDGSGNACRIKYSGNDTFYWKSWKNLKIINKPLTVNIVGKIIFCDKVPVYGLREVIQFNSYFKLYYSLGYTKLVEKNRIKIVSDITETREIKNFIEYLKAVAVLMPTEDGQNFLLKQLEKLTVLDDSVLGKFLQGKLGRRDNKKIIIFPVRYEFISAGCGEKGFGRGFVRNTRSSWDGKNRNDSQHRGELRCEGRQRCRCLGE